MSSLQFVYGPASCDHQKYLVKKLFNEMQDHPQDRFYFLVPNHIKFSTEIDVLNQLRELNGGKDLYAQSQVQILSFSRLAWMLLKDDPAYQKPRVSNVGLTMLVAKNLEELPPADLAGFAHEVGRPGFTQELTKQLLAFENGRIAPDDGQQIMAKIKAKAGKGSIPRMFEEKIKVLFKIYQKFHDELNGRLQTSAIYEMLAVKLNHDDFSHSHFYLNRFNGEFTAREAELVEAIIKNAASTTIGMVSDKPYSGHTLPDENDLYAETGRQYERLAAFARQENITILRDIQATETRVGADVQEVERWMASQARMSRLKPYQSKQAQIHFFTASSQLDELSKTAAIIRHLVAIKKYRYRDFLIISRHLDGYATMIEPVFKANEIPIFNDNDRSMANHPFVTLLEGLFKLAAGNYSLSNIMQLLKTELLFPSRTANDDDLSTAEEKALAKKQDQQQFLDDVYHVENWCLEFGRGKDQDDWCNEKIVWHTDITEKGQASSLEDLALNRVRDYVKDELAPAARQLSQVKTGKEAAAVLYQALDKLQIADRLREWGKEAGQAGQLQAAQEPQQVWNTFVGILDEYVDILGKSSDYSLDQFTQLMMVGFQTATYSQIPSTMDQVLISETGITQTNQRKVVFMIGSTDDVMPETPSSNGLLDDNDLQLINSGLADGQYLPATGMKQLDNEPLVNCLGMLSAKESLYLSAPLMGTDETARSLSPYMVGLARHFGQWDEQNNCLQDDLPFAPQADSDFKEIWPFISAPAATQANYARVLASTRNWQGRTQMGSIWKKVSLMMNREQLRKLWAANHYQNQTTDLSPQLAMQLYGQADPEIHQLKADDWRRHNTLYASISQLQTFYRNPYEYFLQYGLQLQPRAELTISTANSGVFYHDTMEKLIRDLTRNGEQALGHIKREELDAAVGRAIQWALDRQPALTSLSKEARFAYQLGHLEQVAYSMAHVMQLQAGYSKAQIITTEQQFGNPGRRDDRHDKQEPWPALIYRTHLKDQGKFVHPERKVYVRGRIDRVDTVSVKQQSYLNVIDYKSSNHEFDLTTAYAGLDLQLLTYLNSLRGHLSDQQMAATIGGALYLQISMPNYDYQDYASQGRAVLELNSHNFKGLLLNDLDYLSAMDKGLNPETSSKGDLLQVRFSASRAKKDEDKEIKARARTGNLLVNPQQLSALLDRNRDLITEATQKIFAGDISLAPYRLDQRTGLEYSDYLDIFAFDNVLDQQKFRDIDKKQATDWLAKFNSQEGKEK